MSAERVLPAPCLVVLVGPPASGKSTWAARTFGPTQVVSSDALRAVVGESEHDLAASADAFAVLDEIVARRLRRRLTTVVDTLGVDEGARQRWRDMARRAGVPAVAVVFDTPASECRRRNQARAVKVPADVIANQLRRWPGVVAAVRAEPWDDVMAAQPAAVVPAALAPRLDQAAEAVAAGRLPPTGMSVGLHLSAFAWPGGRQGLGDHLGRIVADAEAAGVEHVWLMDHLRQIPQVGRSWDDLPDPYGVLAWIAARTERVRLGVLVTPAFLRPVAVLAKAVATLDVLSAGRAVCGLGVGWYAHECAAAGISFPSVGDRYAALEDALGALPALWGKGSPRFDGRTVSIPEALSYPRPVQDRIPVLVGGSGRRTLRLAARHADACNVFGDSDAVAERVAILGRHCDDIGRDPAAVTVTHLSTVLVGRDRAETAALVDRLRPPRRSAERYAADVNAGTVDDHVRRAARLAAAGVQSMIVSLPDVAEPGAVERLGALVARVREIG